MKQRRLIGMVLAVLAIALGVWLLSLIAFRMRYGPASFTGDGRLSDDGFWTYPRYRISFPSVSLNRSTNRSFQIQNFPSVPWTFGLRIHDRRELDVVRL